MKTIQRLAIYLGILIIGLSLHQPGLTASAQSEMIVAFIARVYRPYLVDPMAPQPDIAWFDRGLLSRDFLRIVREDQTLAGDDMVGYIDADPICACQDWGHFSYKILSIRKIATRRLVTVRLHNWDDVHVMTLVLLPKGHGGFVIDDITDDVYRPSFKVWMTKALRSGPIK